MMNLFELQTLVPGAQIVGDGEAYFVSVSTDTRKLDPGALYVALRGERFDGHEFAADAAAQGAAALMVDHPLAIAVPQILVADTRLALGQLAAGWRTRFELPLIAVTGSNGKTTVTQMLAAILAAAHGESGRLATRGNLNNDIGLPLTLFGLNVYHRAAVLELGMNHPGEIAYLAAIARPTAALVNNAQREHQEFMDGVEATAHENGAAIAALGPEGTAIFPADDPCAPIWRQLAGDRPVLDFAVIGPAAVTARCRPGDAGTELSIAYPTGSLAVALPLAGRHNIHNALAATAAALAIGTSPAAIRQGLESFVPVAGRGVWLRTPTGATVIDDTYNANPDSVRAAVDLLADRPEPRVLVLGDMGEVGNAGPAFHREVGAYAAARGVGVLLGLGDLCAEAVAAFSAEGGRDGRHFTALEELLAAARDLAEPAATLLIKGSRFMRMERVVGGLREAG